ncbi:hypothetical protein RJ640_016613 [Escallonia rubra]|uniref:DUF8040 domain-containing protein n=1 Tax=Escallonia rubra TaxID=112253 RepID=A0AA88RFG7_9ASTE|nr:hypothetical protein RJ640_016613 [Escallonia rubra]
MGPNAFGRLVRILRETGRLTDKAYSCVEEQAAKSLYILAHNERNRSIRFFFHWSTETTSRHFHKFFRAIISFKDNPTKFKSFQKFGITIDSFRILRNVLFFWCMVYVKIWVYCTIWRNTIPSEGIFTACTKNS